MWQFVIAIIIAVVAVVVIGGTALFAPSGRKSKPIATAVTALFFAFGLYAWGGVKSVPVKNIGIPSALGNVGSVVYQHGTYETWDPFLSFTNVDETVQTTTFEATGATNGIDCKGALAVRIGGQQSACANVTIQWQIQPGAAISLYEDYANHGDLMKEITNAVVVREFETVVNQVLGDYDPITDQQNVSDAKTSTSQFTKFAPTIKDDMVTDIGSQIKVIAVYLPKVVFDPTIENALSSIQQAHANYAVAVENELVNNAKSTALRNLGNPTMNQLIAQCLVEAEANHNLQCIPGSTTSLNIQGSGAPAK